jgi:hypothetical protein
MFKKKTLSIAAAILLAHFTAGAQTALPNPSEQTSTVLKGQSITVDYSAPSLQGRKVLGNLIPIDKIWGLGDGTPATLKTPVGLKIGDINVPPGTYALYSTITSKGYWLIINKQTKESDTGYDQRLDLGRVRLNNNDTDGPIERFLVDFEYSHDNKTELHLKWGYSESWVHITAY